jgi:hypothetical protein
MAKNTNQLTIYPSAEVKRAAEQIGEDDHGRPVSKIAEMALRAFVVMYRKDKWAALKMADEFDHQPAMR